MSMSQDQIKDMLRFFRLKQTFWNDHIENVQNVSTKVEETTSQLSDFKIGDRVKAKKNIYSSKTLLVLQECHGDVKGVNTTKSTISVFNRLRRLPFCLPSDSIETFV